MFLAFETSWDEKVVDCFDKKFFVLGKNILMDNSFEN